MSRQFTDRQGIAVLALLVANVPLTCGVIVCHVAGWRVGVYVFAAATVVAAGISLAGLAVVAERLLAAMGRMRAERKSDGSAES